MCGGGGGGDPSHTLEDVRSREAGGDPPLPYKVSGGRGVVVTPRTLEDVRGGVVTYPTLEGVWGGRWW